MNTRNLLLGISISAVLIYIIIWQPQVDELFHGEVDVFEAVFGRLRIDFFLVWGVLKGVYFLPLIVAMLVTPAHVLIRSHRWVLMIAPLGRLRVRDSYSLQMVGYLANTVLPFRIGEVIRAVLLGRRINIAKSTALATVVLERVIDIICLLVVTVVVGFLFPFPQSVKQGAVIIGVGSVMLIAGIFYLAFSTEPFGGVIGRAFSLLPRKISEKVRRLTVQFADGFSMLRASHRTLPVIFESLFLWLMYGLQVFLVFVAFDFQNVYPQIATSPVLAGFVILVISAAGLSLPSAPGGVGTFHAANIFALSLFGVSTGPAAGFAAVIHIVTVLFYVVIGIPFLWREGIRFGELRHLGKNEGVKEK